MSDKPFSFVIPTPSGIPSRVDNHITRKLSSLKGQFLDQNAYEKMVAKDDCLVYEVYEVRVPEKRGDLLSGISIVYPGKVGQEFFMTKGHFHEVLETAEIYYTLSGEGYMVMETPEGDTSVERLLPGQVLYVPPRWAHRSLCTSRQQPLTMYFIYPAEAGHDYGTIEKNGFRKLVLEGAQGIEIVDNPRWKK